MTVERDRERVVVASVLEDAPEAALARIRSLPRACALVEIRADRLRPGDLQEVIREAGRPVMVTARRDRDGGFFTGSEGERRTLFESALRAGARLIDVEWGSEVGDLAATAQPERVVVSHHGAPCRADVLRALYREMSAVRGVRLKIVPHADRVGDLSAVCDTLELARRDGRELSCFATGRAGTASRVLALSWGSWATYGATTAGRETALGQIPVRDLLDVYRVAEIGPRTALHALIGSSVSASPSPAMHNAAYSAAGLDARYLAIETDDLHEVLPLLGAGGTLGLEALAITMPFKEIAARNCEPGDDVARLSGAVNTVVASGERRIGYNTDGPAIRELLAAHLELRGARVACVGAGGTARAAASALRLAGAEVTLFNRSQPRAQAAAAEIGVSAAELRSLPSSTWDALIQATPLGAAGEEILSADRLVGRVVLDAAYGPSPTPLTTHARRQGLAVIDGFDLLVEQAMPQYGHMTGASPSRDTMVRAGYRWIRRRRDGEA
jgi:3-dehydroquinate dehydratase/shikimate dehydrogenase